MTLCSPDSRVAHTEPPLFAAAVWQRGERADLRLVFSPKLISLATADGLSYSPSNCEDTGENIIKSSSTLAREKMGRNPRMETFAGHKSSSKCSQCVLPRWGTAESCSEGFPPNQGLRGEILYLLPQNVQEVRNCFLFSLQDILWVGYIHFHIIILQDFWVLASLLLTLKASVLASGCCS